MTAVSAAVQMLFIHCADHPGLAMSLPLKIPYPPMEAETVPDLPDGDEWQYEPKWDGFRALVFRDGPKVELQSKAGNPLSRYFPELVDAVARLKPAKCVLDGEIIVREGGKLSFDALLQRIHPAASRIRKLAGETPGILVVFDLLVDDTGRDVTRLSLRERRDRLQRFTRKYLSRNKRIRLSPVSLDLSQAKAWLCGVGGDLDGVIAKRLDLPYQSGERTGMVKVKNLRTADCVIGGFRYASKGAVVGSLLLGLYDSQGKLNHVGFTSGIKQPDRAKLTRQLRKMIEPPGFTGNAPGAPSRWSTERSTEWEPLRPELVAEVQYDHFSGGRFRHGTKFVRWRPDKDPRRCTMKQVAKESKAAALLD